MIGDVQQFGQFDPVEDPTAPGHFYGMLTTITRKFKLIAKSTAGTELKRDDWGYTWSNEYLKWLGANAPEQSCTDWRLGAGKFTDPILITGLRSEYSNPAENPPEE